jgi:hypothetical protein
MDSERRMRITSWFVEKPIAACMVLLLAAPVARAEPLPRQDVASAQGEQEAPPAATEQAGSSAPSGETASQPGTPVSSQPPSPVAQAGQSGDRVPADNDSQAGTTPPQASSANSQAGTGQDQNSPAKPVGTAAAPAVTSKGIAGSRVSGAAIAPAKQRRVRIFMIRVAVIVAACVAVGTVVALTHATPSQPR